MLNYTNKAMNNEIVRIHDVRYMMEMRGGGDIWRLVGMAENHPTLGCGQVHPSTPVEYNEETKILKTASGRVYQICSFYDEFITVRQIKKDIAEKGYEIH